MVPGAVNTVRSTFFTEPERREQYEKNDSVDINGNIIYILNKKEDVSNFLEVGYGKTLCGLVKKTLPNANTFHFNDEPSLLEIAKTLAG